VGQPDPRQSLAPSKVDTISTGARLAASQHLSFGKRKTNQTTPSTYVKKFKQTDLFQFLTPQTQKDPITPPATVLKLPQNLKSPFQNPLVSITNAQDIPALPGGLVVSKEVFGDGNCLPRAILLAMTGSQDSHADLRKRATVYISEHPSFFLSDIQLLGYSSVEAYCSRMSKGGEFGDVVMLMACCITENVTIQLFTWNCHESNIETVQTMSCQTFSPVNGAPPSKAIQVHLDTGDSTQIRQGSVVIGRRQTQAPHYDTFRRRTPLSDITNTTFFAPSRIPLSDKSNAVT
jgi:hypothetical protein